MYSSNMQYLFVCETLLYNARFKPSVVNGITLREGQMLFKTEELARLCNMSVGQIRRALKKFSDDGGIATENMGKNGLIITLLPPFFYKAEGHKKYDGYKNNRSKKNTYKNGTEQKNEVSYDLKRAEERARQGVPKLVKRKR